MVIWHRKSVLKYFKERLEANGGAHRRTFSELFSAKVTLETFVDALASQQGLADFRHSHNTSFSQVFFTFFAGASLSQ